MTARTQVFCYPEELLHLAPEALVAEVEALGAGALSVAVAYHRARRVLPRHGCVSIAPPGCLSVTPDPAAYGALAPARTGSRELERRLLVLRARCADAGLGFHAWIVALHHEPLVQARPELAACTADGTPAAHALCPSHEEVADFCAALVGDVCRRLEPDAVDLEAALYPGWEPAYTLTLALQPLGRGAAYAAQCFCPACAALMRAAGHEPEELRARTLAAACLGGGEPRGDGLLVDALAGVRTAGAARVLRGAAAAARAAGAGLRVLAFGEPRDLALQGLTAASAAEADGAGVGLGRASGAELAARMRSLRALLPHAPLLATTNWAPERGAAAYADDARALAAAGADALGLYNLSLVPHHALPALGAAAAAFTAAASPAAAASGAAAAACT